MRIISNVALAGATAALLAACSGSPPSASYFPLDAGHRWVYDSAAEREDNSVEHEPLVLRTLGEESLPSGGRAHRRRSDSGVDYWLRADDTGVFRVASKTDLEAEPSPDKAPRYVLKTPLTVGTQWQAMTTSYLLRRRNEFPPEIRHTHAPPETHVAWALCETRSVLVASRGYLRRRGTPRQPQELVDHDCLHYLRAGEAAVWRLQSAQGQPVVAAVVVGKGGGQRGAVEAGDFADPGGERGAVEAAGGEAAGAAAQRAATMTDRSAAARRPCMIIRFAMGFVESCGPISLMNLRSVSLKLFAGMPSLPMNESVISFAIEAMASPLMAAAANPRARSFSATSSVACLVRTKTIIASNGSVSRIRVSASIFRGPATWM